MSKLFYIFFVIAFSNLSLNASVEPPVKKRTCPFSIDFVVERTGCNPNDTRIVLTPLNGIGPYSYSLDGGLTTQTDSIFLNRPPGNYSALVIDSAPSSCAHGAPIIIPDVLTIDNVTADSACYYNNGKIIINTTGGEPSIKYSIDGGTNFLIDTSTFINVAPGTYPIVVEDKEGCTVNTTVDVGAFPVISPSLDTIDMLCNTGVNAGIVNVTIPGNDLYDFSIDGGFNYVNQTSFSDSTLVPGDYTLIIIDKYSCRYDYDFDVIQQLIDDSLGVTNEICNKVDGEIRLFGIEGEAPFEFSIDGGATFSTVNIYPNLAAGNYFTQVRDNIGCISFDTVKVTNFGGVAGTIVAADTLCRGNSLNISVNHNGGQNVSFAWNNSLPNNQTHVVSPTVTTDYNVVMTDVYGCTDTADKQIFVEDQPNLTVNPTNILACLGDTIAITATGARNYTWFNGDTNAILLLPIAGNATVTVVGNNGSCTDNGSVVVQIRPSPTLVLNANNTVVNTGEIINFSSNGSTTSSTSWDFRDGGVSQLTNPQHKFNNPGVYWVTLTGNMGTCFLTDSIMITVNGPPLSLEEKEANLFQIFPNPNNGVFTINAMQEGSILFIDATGKLIYQSNLIIGDNTINTSSISKGVYSAIYSSKGISVTKKLIVK